MTEPLALLLYESLFPGSHLVNRLEDQGYRVHSVSDPDVLVQEATREKPILIIADLAPRHERVCSAIAGLQSESATDHIPVIALTSAANEAGKEAAREAGARLVVLDNAILAHLDQFLEQALEL